MSRNIRFARYAWFVVGFNLLVILWGAFVRASGSGAGCGSHWPLCNGQVVPQAPSIKTLIEISHRATSGIALLLVVGLLVWALRAFQRGSLIRRAAAASMFFMLTEALVGAGLVLFEYVAENKSIARGFWMSGHLINTHLLIAAMTLTAWLASTDLRWQWNKGDAFRWLLVAALLGSLVLGVSGAVTALGGTLFPVTSLAEGLRQDLSPASHILIRLRFYHPLIAGIVSTGLFALAIHARMQRPGAQTRFYSTALIVLVLVQLLAGIVNLLLHAPIWLQLVHLLLADLAWIALLLMGVNALSQSPRTESVGATKLATA